MAHIQATDLATIIQQVKELTATFEQLVLQIKPEVANQQVEFGSQNINCFYDLYRLWQEQVANFTAIQNIQAEEFQNQILEMNKLREEILNNLKNQEETHMRQIDQLKQQHKSELEAKDERCLKLEQELLRLREDNERNTQCSICLDPWTFTGHHRLVALHCGHLFGEPCIRDYLQRANACPNCRAMVYPKDIRYIYGRPL
ncbi:E3 ubiquitin-protein ligase rnf8-B-like [Drosophila sulfurigaster albostrigata]|uniref:E3 ubiquitin-protein ligase rnf8-B-like n=1 Tax=Drosophila sulfurigaster albostrigata TaxID=89887 RepID=UPI002D21C091|nr:E3 ubiquitin-protein ligase rnf8-B-like [Drosophila sulfurigaster albostrigata]